VYVIQNGSRDDISSAMNTSGSIPGGKASMMFTTHQVKNWRSFAFAVPICLHCVDRSNFAFNLLSSSFLKILRVNHCAAENTKEQETIIFNVLHDI
jgi:hypothetical protein